MACQPCQSQSSISIFPVPSSPTIDKQYRGSVTVVDLSAAAADTEYSLALPSNVLGLIVVNKSAAGLRFAFLASKVADPTATSSDNFEVSPLGMRDLGQISPGASTTLYYASTLRGAIFSLELDLGSQ